MFIDEIGELPLAIQAKLLRALQSGEVQPVGGRPEHVDARLVAATNRDLASEAKAGRFREDLFYRLNVVPIRVPPLRERPEDIEPLLHAFVRQYVERYGMTQVQIEPALIEAMRAHPWPGNVRELENTVARLLALAPDERLTLSLVALAGRAAAGNRRQRIDQGRPRPQLPAAHARRDLRARDHRRAVRRREQQPERDRAPPRRVAPRAGREAAQVPAAHVTPSS